MSAFAQRTPYDAPRDRARDDAAYRATVNDAAATGAPVTLQPGASGPGAIDKTHPGTERGIAPSPRDAGTSSAGSP